MTHRHYDRAPIVEAVIDFRVSFDREPSIDQLEDAASRLAAKFPTKAPIRLQEIHLLLDPKVVTHSATDKGAGVRLANASNTHILQLSTGGFTYSHMAPYTEWKNLRDEAQYAWAIFERTCNPIVVARLATRAINRIEIPQTSVEIEEFFNLYPKIPGGIAQNVGGMFLQLQMPQNDIDAMAVINQALVNSNDPTKTALVLDFDIFRDGCKIKTNGDELWQLTESFHARRNDLFEACITDKVRELIK